MHCSAWSACICVGVARITASTPGCFRLSARAAVQCGIPNFLAPSSVPAGLPPASLTTSIPSIFAIASRCFTPNAPCPATQIFMLSEFGHETRHAPLLLQAARSPHILGGHELRDVVLTLTLSDQSGHAGTQLLYVVAVGLQTGFVSDRAMAGDHGIEIKCAQDSVQRLGPFDQAAAAWVVDQRAGAGHQVASVDGPQRREIHDGVAVGVAASEITRAY